MAAASKATFCGCAEDLIIKGDVICEIRYIKLDQVPEEQREYFRKHEGWMLYPRWLIFDNQRANCYIVSNKSPDPPRAWIVANKDISDFKSFWLSQRDFEKLREFMVYVKQYESKKSGNN